MKILLALIILMLSGCVTTYDIVIVEDVVVELEIQKGDSNE